MPGRSARGAPRPRSGRAADRQRPRRAAHRLDRSVGPASGCMPRAASRCGSMQPRTLVGCLVWACWHRPGLGPADGPSFMIGDRAGRRRSGPRRRGARRSAGGSAGRAPEPGRPRRAPTVTGRDLVAVADERHAQETRVGQQPRHDARRPSSSGRRGPRRGTPARSSSSRARAPSRSVKRRSSPGRCGRLRRSTKWTTTRRSRKNRWAARVAGESSEPEDLDLRHGLRRGLAERGGHARLA